LSALGAVPLSKLSTAEREQLNAVFGELVTELAPVAAVCDVRRSS
jgi:iron uptake system component EfeO